MNPLDGNPLETRRDLQRAAANLFEPLVDHVSPGGARVKPGPNAALFPDSEAQLEGFARPLWMLAPLAAGGGAFDHWERYREGLANGTDPDHEEYWGDMPEISQAAVEMAPIGFALALAPEELWDPLDDAARENVAAWLGQTNDVQFSDGNWRFFRVLANLGLRTVGAPHDWDQVGTDLDVLEESYIDDGWYSDGPGGARDYYASWEMQVDGLVYATLAEGVADRSGRIRERAAAFATDFAHWFDDRGAALPYGRSLTYRFAQGSFWGALAFADVSPPDWSWGAVKRAWLRHLRWWCNQEPFTDGGVLSVGYGYPTQKTAESYNSPSSPYWASKFFLPLALPEDHPFWRAEEEPLPDRDERRSLAHAKMVVARDADGDHVVAHPAGDPGIHEAEKYNKFAYSTAFGGAVASAPAGLGGRGVDGTLALSADGRTYGTRHDVQSADLRGDVAHSVWEPLDGVTVASWVVPAPPWHVRVHRVETDRPVESAEGGFSFPAGDPDAWPVSERRTDEVTSGDGEAVVRSTAGVSGIRDAAADRVGSVVAQDPNTNLLHPRTRVPVLRGDHDPGEHVLAAAVLGTPRPAGDPWTDPPTVAVEDGRAVVDRPGGERTVVDFEDW